MRWPMEVMAYELIDARVPIELVPYYVAFGWQLSDGDDQWRSMFSDSDGFHLVGAYALYGDTLQGDARRPGESLRTDASIIATIATTETTDGLRARLDRWQVPDYVYEMARQATANPSPGVTPFDLAMNEINRPIPNRADSLAYRMARVDGALDAARNRLN